MNTNEIRDRVMQLFDREVRSLSGADYREVLEEMIGDFEARLDCVKEELAVDGED